jgi:uncharacterized membrane protein
MTSSRSTKSGALLLFAFVIVAWGLNWTVTKLIVTQVTPLWTTAIRTGIGALALLAMLAASKQFRIPKQGDVPVVLAISLFHMVAFAALMTTGLKYVPVGRSIVLGYTTPLWVAPAAWLLLKEDLSARQLVGIMIGLTGLAVMFNPSAFDWTNRDAVLDGQCHPLARRSHGDSYPANRTSRYSISTGTGSYTVCAECEDAFSGSGGPNRREHQGIWVHEPGSDRPKGRDHSQSWPCFGRSAARNGSWARRSMSPPRA